MGREEEETRGGKRRRENFFQKERSGWRLKGEGGGGKDRKTNGREEERKRERERGHRARVCFASAPRQVDKFACFFPDGPRILSSRFVSFPFVFFSSKKESEEELTLKSTMVTGKVANDALTSLLSDSLADMGVKDNKKSKPMSTMRKAASGPVPSSSYSPTDYAPVLGSQDQSFSKVQSTPSVAPTPPLDSSVGAGGDVSSLFDMLGDLSSSVPAPPAASAASGASAAPVMVDMTGGVTKTMSGSDKNDSYDHLDDFFGSITSQRSSQDKQESPTAAAADEDDVMLKVKVKSNASSPFAPQDDFEPLDLSPSTQGDDIFGTGPSTPHSYSNLGGDFDILNANPYDARGQEEDVPYEPTEQGEEVKREQSAEQAQDTTGGLDIFASEPAASEGSKAEGGFTSLEDLMGGGGGGGEGGDKVASESPAVEPVGSVEDGLDIFATEPASGGSVAKTAEKKDQGFTSLEDLMGATGGASSAPSTSAPAGADAQPANVSPYPSPPRASHSFFSKLTKSFFFFFFFSFFANEMELADNDR